MKKILVVDDSSFFRKRIKDLLGKQYEIVEADCGTAALEQFNKESPIALILLDLVMPESDKEGLRVLEEIRKVDRNAPAVIMVTSVKQDQVKAGCEQAGAIGYVTKPFDEHELRETVAKLLS